MPEERAIEAPIAAAAGESELLRWRVHLLRRDPGRLTVIACAALLVSTVAWLLFRSPLLIGAGVLMIASAVGEYVWPVTYRLTDSVASCRYGMNHFRLYWSELRRVLLYTDGVRLSPLSRPSRLDAFRGVYLRFAPDGQPGDRDSVIALIERLRPAAPNRDR